MRAAANNSVTPIIAKQIAMVIHLHGGCDIGEQEGH